MKLKLNRLILTRTQAWIGYLRNHKADLLAIGLIALFFVVFFMKAIFGREYLITGDALFYNYPMRTVAWRMLRGGELPLWTPYILSGYPLLSMAQLGLGYPLTWGYLFLPGLLAEKIYVLAPFLLAPTFTYAYLRELNRSPLAALLGALTFGYGGMMASPLAHNGLIPNAIMWLPLLLIALERARRSPLVPCLLAATFTYALSVLTGLAQGFLTVGVLAGAYALWLGLTTGERSESVWLTREVWLTRLSQRNRWRPLFIAVGAALLAIGISAFQILETARVVRRSVRSTLSYEAFAQGSFMPTHLLKSFAMPLFYLVDMHAAIPPLAAVLVFVAICAHALRMNVDTDLRVFFWGAVAIVAGVLMMGQFTPVYRLVYYIPLLNLFRVPSRHTAEWTFAAGVLAAYGWDALTPTLRRYRESHLRSRVSTSYAAIGLLAFGVLVGIAWWLKVQTLEPNSPDWAQGPRIYLLFKATFVILLAMALFRASLIRSQRWRTGLLATSLLILCFVEPSLLIARWWGPSAQAAGLFKSPTPATRFLQQFPAAENRIYTRVDLMSELESDEPRFDGPNLSAVWGLHNAAGYEPLMLERYSLALGGAWLNGVHTFDRGAPDPSLFTKQSHVLDILNTTFVVSYPHLATSISGVNGPPIPHSDNWQPVYENQGALIMRNTRALPRAWLVAEAQSVRREVALSRIRGESAPEFDPRRIALLEVAPQELPNLPGGELRPGSTARIVAYEPNRLAIETNAPTATVLMVSELFYPGWEATIDQRPARISLADYLLRGVAVPAGEHKIEMRYTAPAARNGALISGFTVILLGTLLVYERRRASRRASARMNSAT